MNGESVSLLQYHGLDHFNFSVFLLIWNCKCIANCKWLSINVCLWFKDSASGENTEAEIALIEIISIIARLNTFVKKANLLMERIFSIILNINGQVKARNNRVIRLKTITVIFTSALYCGLKYRLHVLY